MKTFEADKDKVRAHAAYTVQFPLYHKVEGRSCHLNIGTLKATVEQVIEDLALADDWLKAHPPEVE